MRLPHLRQPDSIWDVVAILAFGLLIVGIDRIVSGPGPLHLEAITVYELAVLWAIWASYRIIINDSLYPYPQPVAKEGTEGRE